MKQLPEDTEGVPAAVLIIRNGVEAFCHPDALFAEQTSLDVDKKAKMYGRESVGTVILNAKLLLLCIWVYLFLFIINGFIVINPLAKELF